MADREEVGWRDTKYSRIVGVVGSKRTDESFFARFRFVPVMLLNDRFFDPSL